MSIKLKDLDEATKQKLRDELAAEQKATITGRKKKRVLYEKNREKRIQKIIKGVNKHFEVLKEFKDYVGEIMEEQHAELEEFGLIKSSSKGGFHIMSDDGSFKIERARDTTPKWDETSLKGVALIRDFLMTQDANASEDTQNKLKLLMSLLEKNAAGELEYSKVMIFIKHQDAFDAPEWKEGLKLLIEGYKIEFKKYTYRFSKKDKEGAFVPMSLNFSNL